MSHDGDQHRLDPALLAALEREAIQRRSADRHLTGIFIACIGMAGAAYVLGGYQPTVWFWASVAAAGLVGALALVRLIIQFVICREMLRDPWDD